MKLEIDNKIFEKFPDVNIGILAAKGIDNKGTNEEVFDLIKEREKEIRTSFNTETLSLNPKIECWRKAFSSFGAKPKKYKSSVENLLRIILEGNSIRHINKIVDIYNYISIKHILPLGGDDTDNVAGDIKLTLARGDEKFVELNSEEVKNPKPGEVVYKDDKEILCRRWNWRECDKTKMTEETKNIVLVLEALPPVTKGELENAIDDLKELIKKYCNGEMSTFILNKCTPLIEF